MGMPFALSLVFLGVAFIMTGAKGITIADLLAGNLEPSGTDELSFSGVASPATSGNSSSGDESYMVSGGVRSRIVQIAQQAASQGYDYYSQSGKLTDDPTPPRGARSDCSQFIRAVYLQAGAKDPGTNTWTQALKGKRVKTPQPGDIVMSADTSHAELYIGDGKTIGHGSGPIDGWSIDGMKKTFGKVYYISFGLS